MRIYHIGTRGIPTTQGGIEKHIEEIVYRKEGSWFVVVALGKQADDGLKRLGELRSGIEHETIFHPQYAKRFCSKTLDYGAELKRAMRL